MRLAGRALAVLGVAVAASCTVEVDVDGKACPCGEGYHCDDFEGICKQQLCAVSADELVVAWATPHTLAFEWNPTGKASDFHSYELVVGTSEADVLSGTGDVRVQTLAENPALGSLDANGSLPMFTLVADLSPSTEYFARLRITDSNTCVSSSKIVAETTPKLPLKPIVLFDDEVGVTADPDLAALLGNGDEAYIEYSLAADPMCVGTDLDPFCGQPVKANFEAQTVGDAGGQANGVEEGEFGSAYLEVVLFYDGILPAYTATAFVSPQWPDASAANFRFDLPSFSLEPTSGYHSIEVPLRVLHLSEGDLRPLTHRDLVDMPLRQAAIGAQWHEDSVVRIDAFRIQH